MAKLIGNKTGISGIYEPEDNVSLVKNLDDLSSYVYNRASNTSIFNLPAGIVDLYISPDESKVYFANSTTDTIYQYNISGTDLTLDYFDLKSSPTLLSQEATVSDLFFKDDGTKVYIIGTTNDTIYQYSLGTAWDISTASYESKSFSVGTQEGTPRSLFFKPDGLKVYIIGDTNDTIYQYSLSVAWDISTASYDSKSFSVGSQDTIPQELFFKPDGTKVYIMGDTNDRIYQYSLSTPWDISTASHDNKSFSVGSQEISARGLFFKSDGTKVYMIGLNNDAVYQYSLGVTWDISTASYESKSFSVGNQEATPTGLFFKDDGTKFYIIGTTNDRIYQYDLEVPWNLILSPTKSLFVGTQDASSSGIALSNDLSKLYMVGSTNRALHQYDLIN